MGKPCEQKLQRDRHIAREYWTLLGHLWWEHVRICLWFSWCKNSLRLQSRDYRQGDQDHAWRAGWEALHTKAIRVGSKGMPELKHHVDSQNWVWLPYSPRLDQDVWQSQRADDQLQVQYYSKRRQLVALADQNHEGQEVRAVCGCDPKRRVSEEWQRGRQKAEGPPSHPKNQLLHKNVPILYRVKKFRAAPLTSSTHSSRAHEPRWNPKR